MDTSKAEPRPFQPVMVGACYAQTAKDRFGSQAARTIQERERILEADFGLAQGESQDLPESEAEADGKGNSGEECFIPFMQRFRNNLTALSQLYNLYMVAYQGQIFVYVPRSVPSQRIPSQPDLRLVVPATHVSRHIRGCIEKQRPHLINHIIVGTLGTEEIVVTSFDDGDVASYKTHEIADCILSRQPDVPVLLRQAQPEGPRTKKPKPFFHENVGKTAWGLAVHQKSRLIAVTSNRCEVTVFAPALRPDYNIQEKDPRPAHRVPDWCDACQPRTCNNVESHVRQRARSWRIVVTLGIGVSNMPSVCFIDDATGCASLVCAVDIKGNIWLAEIWKPHVPATMLPCRFDAQGPRVGWGILALRRSSFVTVETIGELLGTKGDIETLPFHRLDIAQSLREIAENPYDYPEDAPLRPDAAHDANLAMMDGDGDSGGEGGSDHGETTDEDATETDDGSDAGGTMTVAMLMDGIQAEVEAAAGLEAPPPAQPQAPPPAQPQAPPHAQPQAPPPAQLQAPPAQLHQLLAQLPAANLLASPTLFPRWKAPEQMTLAEKREEAQKRREYLKRPMVYFPHNGTTATMPHKKLKLLAFLVDDSRQRNETGNVLERLQLMEDYYLLSFWQEDIELGRFRLWTNTEPNRETGVVCVRALKHSMSQPRGLMQQLFEATDRISLIAHIPELSLVVAATVSGRVLLLTPTRLRRPVMREGYPLRVGFRIEWILPRRSDESRWRRQPRPLYGMAVGPVQGEAEPGEAGSGTGAGSTRPARLFRVMLHYRNHDVLTYEITRVMETGKMCVF